MTPADRPEETFVTTDELKSSDSVVTSLEPRFSEGMSHLQLPERQIKL